MIPGSDVYMVTDYAWEIRKLQEQKKLVLGSQRTLKLIRKGKIKKVYLASNAPVCVKSDIAHFNKVSPLEIVELSMPVEELGTVCKRPFCVATIGVIE